MDDQRSSECFRPTGYQAEKSSEANINLHNSTKFGKNRLLQALSNKREWYIKRGKNTVGMQQKYRHKNTVYTLHAFSLTL
jgi:hypothetical protein